MTKEQYKKEVLRQLNNEQHYTKLDADTSDLIRKNIKTATEIYTQHNLLSKKAADIINKPNTRPAKFYTLPKIHKSLSHPPGRPIMSGNNHHTELLSQYVDLHINPYLSHIPSHIKDTNHFIDICKDIKLEPDDKIVTFDISSLYTDIPHPEGIEAIKTFLTPHLGDRKANMVASMTELVLTGNIFEFDNRLYLQKTGTAMGSRMAPGYACIFVSQLEEEILKNAPIKIKLWKRYIDDIFCIIQASETEISEFTKWLNTQHQTIKFTQEYDPKGIPFLDTFVTRYAHIPNLLTPNSS
jgi:hypothetical protein